MKSQEILCSFSCKLLSRFGYKLFKLILNFVDRIYIQGSKLNIVILKSIFRIGWRLNALGSISLKLGGVDR